MTALEMAQKYYPLFWNDARLTQLVVAGILTQAEVELIKGASE